MSELRTIRSALRTVRRVQALKRFAAVGAGTLWVSLSVLTVSAFVLGIHYERPLHFAVLFTWAIAVLGLWAGYGILPALGWRREREVARMLERHVAELRNDLSSALEFGEAIEKGGDSGAERLGSPALMRAHVKLAASRLSGRLDGYMRRLPDYKLRRLRTTGLAVLVTGVFLFAVWPQIMRTGLSRLLIGAPAVEAVTVIAPDRADEILVGSIQVTYQYPAYTGRQSIQLQNLSGRIEVLAGTEVAIEAVALDDTTRAVLVIQPKEGGEDAVSELNMTVEGRKLRVTFTPMQTGTYTFALTGGDGERQVDPIDRALTVVPDQLPQIELITPDGIVGAAPGDVVPFRFAVSDDYGITEIAFVHAFAGDEEHEQRESLVSLDGELVFQDGAGFDLGDLGLQPRDEIVVYIEANDNDTIGGPKAGRSRPVLIRITSEEDRHLEIIQREEALFEAFLVVLGDYLENPIAELLLTSNGIQFVVPDRAPEANQSVFTAARNISAAVGATLDEMRSLLEAMEADELMLRLDYERLQESYDDLHNLYRDEQAILESLGRAVSRGRLNRFHMERVEGQRSKQVGATEQVILLLEEIIDSQQMESLVRTLEELDQIQERLRELLEQYRDTQDPELRAEIERELQRLEARMRELLQRLAEQMQNLPSEHYNVEALQEAGMMGDTQEMADALQQIRDMLEMGDIDAALAALDNLEAQVQSMLDQMSESQASGSGVSELDERISELMEQVADLEAQETDLEDQTRELQDQIREERAEALQDDLQDFLERARGEIAEMQEQINEANTDRLRQHVQSQLDQASEQLQELNESLEQEDIATALEDAQAFRQRMQETQQRLSRANLQRMSGQQREAHEQAAEASRQISPRAAQLESELEQLIERSRPVPGPGDQQRLDELAQMQGDTRERLSQLQQRVAEMGQEMPIIQDELGPPLQEVGRQMGEGENGLRQGQLPRAMEGERQALQGLQGLREQMHQMVARERMGQRNQGQQLSREDVEIPREAEETPEEFRRDILDAMRDDSLQSYREAIRDYYEALVE